MPPKFVLGFLCCCWPAGVPWLCYLDPSEVSLTAVGEAGLWGSLSIWVLDSLPTPPQFTPSSFPQDKIKPVCREEITESRLSSPCSWAMSVLGKPLVPIPLLWPAKAATPWTHCVLVLSAAGGQRCRESLCPSSQQGHSQALHALSLPAAVCAEALFTLNSYCSELKCCT